MLRSATALTIEPFSLGELVRYATAAGVFQVISRTENAATISYELRPVDLWKGSPDDVIIALSKFEPAMPILAVDQKYVLFINPTNQFERVIGFRWGSLRVMDNGSVLDMDAKPVPRNDVRFRGRGAVTDAGIPVATPDTLSLGLLKHRVAEAMRQLP